MWIIETVSSKYSQAINSETRHRFSATPVIAIVVLLRQRFLLFTSQGREEEKPWERAEVASETEALWTFLLGLVRRALTEAFVGPKG